MAQQAGFVRGQVELGGAVRKGIVEGIFPSLDRLGWEKSRLRGLWKVDCEGYMAALAHNVKKLVRRLGRGIEPPDPASPNAGIIA